MYSGLQKSCYKQAEQWKTTIDFLCLPSGKDNQFICGKSIVVFHCLACLLYAAEPFTTAPSDIVMLKSAGIVGRGKPA